MTDLNLPKKRIMQNRASVLKRAVAFGIDLIIIYFIVLLPLIGPIAMELESSLPEDADFLQQLEYSSSVDLQKNSSIMIRSFSMFILILAYFFVFELKLNQTPGKMILKIYVVSREKRLNWKKVMIRNLIFIPLGMITTILWLSEILFIIFTGSRLLDNFAKTDVVEEIAI